MAELTLQVLQDLCADENELLKDEKKLRTFNTFLARMDLGLPIPLEFAIGCLLNNPLVVHKKVSPDVSSELEFTRKLCSNLIKCRILFKDHSKVNIEQEPIVVPSMRTLNIFNRPAAKSKVAEVSSDQVNVEKEKKKPNKKVSIPDSDTPPIVITLDETIEDNDEIIIISDDENEVRKTRKSTVQSSNTSASTSKNVREKSNSMKDPSKRQRKNFQIDYSKVLAADPQMQQKVVEKDSSNSEIQTEHSRESTDLGSEITNETLKRSRASKEGHFTSFDQIEETDNLADLF